MVGVVMVGVSKPACLLVAQAGIKLKEKIWKLSLGELTKGFGNSCGKAC